MKRAIAALMVVLATASARAEGDAPRLDDSKIYLLNKGDDAPGEGCFFTKNACITLANDIQAQSDQNDELRRENGELKATHGWNPLVVVLVVAGTVLVSGAAGFVIGRVTAPGTR